jgi:hypothetical protein
MGGLNFVSAAHNYAGQVPECPWATHRNIAKTGAMQNASNFSRLTAMIFGERFLRKGIQFACRGVRFNLNIPGIRIELGKPTAEFDKFDWRQLLNNLFNGFCSYHDVAPEIENNQRNTGSPESTP